MAFGQNRECGHYCLVGLAKLQDACPRQPQGKCCILNGSPVWSFRRLKVVALVAFLGALPVQKHAWAQSGTEASGHRLRFAIKEICLPIIADHVKFSNLITDYKLQKHVNCNIQECLIQYCMPGIGSLCIPEPSEKSCAISVTGDGDFAKLALESLSILQASGRQWREVVDHDVGLPYKKMLCDSSGQTAVRLSGIRQGDVVGQIPKPLNGPGTSITLKAQSTTFSVQVFAARQFTCAVD